VRDRERGDEQRPSCMCVCMFVCASVCVCVCLCVHCAVVQDERRQRSELNHLTLLLLVSTQLEVFTSLDSELLPHLTLTALHLQNDLLRRLSLFMKDGFRLTSITFLLSVVSSLTLSKNRIFAFFVLRDFVQGVLAALLTLTERSSLLRHVNHC